MSKDKVKTRDLEGIEPAVYKKRWATLAALCFALLGVMLANSSINIALPLLSVDLGLSQLTMTWIVHVYALVFASLLFIAGAFGDRYGRKLALQVGSAIFTAGALYAGFFAQSGIELIAARAVMGLAGALVMPTTLSIIDNVFPRKERPRAIAIWSAISGVGMMLGSIASGVLLEHFTWHALFHMSTIIAGVGLIINQFVVSESKDPESRPVDWLGGLFSALGIFGIVYGITEAPSLGLTDPAVAFSLIGGAISLAVFIWWETKVKSPLLDMKLFKNKAFSVSSLTLTLTFLAMMGVFFSMSQIQQLILGMTPLEASLTMVPMMIPMLFISPFVPLLVKKIGARATITIGLSMVSVAFLVMSQWDASMTFWNLLGGMYLMMGGVSLAMTPGTNILMNSVPKSRAGMGSAMNDTTRELGGALGVAILGAILSASYVSNIGEIANKVPTAAREAVEGSLASALNVLSMMGPQAAALVNDTKEAWMSALSTASIVASGIIAVAAVIAFVALPKHTKRDDEVI